jgi:hypothetical protein
MPLTASFVQLSAAPVLGSNPKANSTNLQEERHAVFPAPLFALVDDIEQLSLLTLPAAHWTKQYLEFMAHPK